MAAVMRLGSILVSSSGVSCSRVSEGGSHHQRETLSSSSPPHWTQAVCVGVKVGVKGAIGSRCVVVYSVKLAVQYVFVAIEPARMEGRCSLCAGLGDTFLPSMTYSSRIAKFPSKVSITDYSYDLAGFLGWISWFHAFWCFPRPIRENFHIADNPIRSAVD